MLLVVADTGPLRYLTEIGQIEILPRLFEKILVPDAVYQELQHRSTPAVVREWAQEPPEWLSVRVAPPNDDPALFVLDDGERAALTLGKSVLADLILIDDQKGAAAALKRGFEVTGTLGLLVRAAQQGMLDLASALAHLKNTNFRYRQEILDDLLKAYGRPNS
jgi:predicted nucleic acid-binding protein